MKKLVSSIGFKGSVGAAGEEPASSPRAEARRSLAPRLGYALVLACLSMGAAATGCNGLLGGDDEEGKSGGGCPDDLEYFEKSVWEPIVSMKCALCHNPEGVAKGTQMVFDTAGTPEAVEKNFETIRAVAGDLVNKESSLLLRPSGRHPSGHGGGTVIEFNSPDYRTLATFASRVNEGKNCEAQPASCEAGAVTGRRLLRLLSRVEYDRTVRDLLGLDASEYRLAIDATVNGFVNNADALHVSSLLVEQLRSAAEDMAQKVVDAPGSLLPCPAESGDAACAAQFIDTFGKRAFRRPLTDQDRDRYNGLYESVAGDEGFLVGVQAVVEAMLQSPSFLYRPELGAQVDGAYQLTPFEVASELSYLIWGTMPDAALLQKAEAGELTTAESVAAEAERMIADPKMEANLAQFMEQWLDIRKLDGASKDGMAYPEYNEGLKQALFQETASFARSVLREGTGSMAELFTAKYSMVDDTLAQLYGLPAPGGEADADGFKKVDLTGTARKGLLTLGSVLTTHARAAESSPIHRGKFVRERLLCQPLQLPPAGLDIVPPGLDPTKSTRERFAAHSVDPICQGCHQLVDPIGFGFEHFDGIGRYREQEEGHPIDDAGEILHSQSTNGEFHGVEELADKLASSADVEACFTLQWLRFGFGVEDQAELSCMASQLTQELSGDKLTIPALIKAIVTSPRFTKRLPDGAAAPIDPGTPTGGDTPTGGAGGSPPSGGQTSSSSSSTTSSTSSGGTTTPGGSAVGVEEFESSTWATGGCKRVVVTNNGGSNVNWEITLSTMGTLNSIYNAVATPASGGTKFVGVDFNRSLAPGGTAEFGFCFQL
jgi:Protein of unknown function (DUF1592)/Protein of unknown function (DUF1588)/Protein of unknown function (DUF1595)/Protein of unknown function (DUF1587)/Protein of unknown function (DUF1585)/Cellulose binding domain